MRAILYLAVLLSAICLAGVVAKPNQADILHSKCHIPCFFTTCRKDRSNESYKQCKLELDTAMPCVNEKCSDVASDKCFAEMCPTATVDVQNFHKCWFKCYFETEYRP